MTKYMRSALSTALLASLLAAAAPAEAAHGPIYEDDPRWNCRTMGNRICGTDPKWVKKVMTAKWVPVSQELADALAEGEAADATTRRWESCRVRHTGSVSTVRCLDGFITRY